MKTKKPEVSILLPAYNAAKYINESIISILNQTYRDFELVIIDDGSDDGTDKIIQKYKKRDNRIISFSQRNKGLVAALNFGINKCKGIWVMRMDADDVASPTRIDRQLYWLKKTNSDIAGSWVKFFGTQNFTWKGHLKNTAIQSEMLFQCPLVHPSTMIKSVVIKKHKFNKNNIHAEDYGLWVDLALHNYKFINVPETLLNYRNHSSQISLLQKNKQYNNSEKIRKKFWINKFLSINVKKNLIEDVFKFTQCKTPRIDLNYIREFIYIYCEKHSNEENNIFMHHMFIIFLKNSPHYSNLYSLWFKLPKQYFYFHRVFFLWIFEKFSIKKNGLFVKFLRKINNLIC